MNALAERLTARLETPLVLLLALGIAWSLADGIWFFLGGAQTDASPTTQTATGGDDASPEGPVLDAEGIARLDLFGTPDGDSGAMAAAASAPETRLHLELLGVFLTEDGSDSSAIIARLNQDGELYHTGDRLPGGAELVEVLSDRIVLRRSGRLETLRFPDATDGDGFAATGGDAPQMAAARPGPVSIGSARPPGTDSAGRPDDASGVDRRAGSAEDASGGNLRERLDEIRRGLEVDPQGTLAEMGVEPVGQGDSGGYRIGGQVPAEQLSKVGLRPGDVVLSVNGRAVGDIENDRQQLDAVIESGTARLEIQRGDRRFFVTTRLQ